MIVWCSDSVVEDAVGGKEAATSFIQSDKEGFQGTEVTCFFVLYLFTYGWSAEFRFSFVYALRLHYYSVCIALMVILYSHL